MHIELPIFPLDNVVLFPKVQVPLYIFEPRYRQMTAEALEGEGRIGMVVVQPRHRSEMGGDPPIFRVGCAGSIARAEANPDGTYQIILEGSDRFEVEAELPRESERLYRIARVRLLEELEPDPGSIAPIRERVLELMRAIAPERADQFRPATFAKLDDPTFVNAFSQSLDFTTLEKQQLIEANGVRARGERLVALLEFRIAERTTTGPPGTGTVH